MIVQVNEYKKNEVKSASVKKIQRLAFCGRASPRRGIGVFNGQRELESEYRIQNYTPRGWNVREKRRAGRLSLVWRLKIKQSKNDFRGFE